MRETPSQPLEPVFVFLVARAQHDELNIFVHEDFIHHAHDEVKAFGRNQTGNEGNHRHAAVFRQAQEFLQGHLVVALAVRTVHIIGFKQVLVRHGVIDIIVDAVDDTKEVILAAAQQAV